MLVFCLLDMHARVNVQTQQNSRREKKKTHETPQKIHSGTLRACALRVFGAWVPTLLVRVLQGSKDCKDDESCVS
jgi:hypothetical protein